MRKQRLFGLVLIALGVLICLTCTDITAALAVIPLGLVLMCCEFVDSETEEEGAFVEQKI